MDRLELIFEVKPRDLRFIRYTNAAEQAREGGRYKALYLEIRTSNNSLPPGYHQLLLMEVELQAEEAINFALKSGVGVEDVVAILPPLADKRTWELMFARGGYGSALDRIEARLRNRLGQSHTLKVVHYKEGVLISFESKDRQRLPERYREILGHQNKK